MSGEMLIEPSGPPHVCDPPGQHSAIYTPDFPSWRHRTVSVDGGLWRCDCGQHWLGFGNHWQDISARQARRIITRRGTTP